MSAAATAHLTVPINPKRDHICGPTNAMVTLVEYGDYECPHCGAAHYVVKRLQTLLHDTTAFAFRHFPLSTVHPHAALAAEAAEAAGAQGMFWPMHDILFENQESLSSVDILQYAAAVGLDTDRFVRDLNTHRHAPRVREDFLGGVRSGVNGTPTFFINEIRHDGPPDLESLLAGVQKAAKVGAPL